MEAGKPEVGIQTTASDFIVEHRGLRTKARLEYGGELDERDEAVILPPGIASPELGELRHELAKLGHAAVSFEQPRALPLGWQLMDVAGLRAGVVEKIMDKTDDGYGLEKSVLAGHSLGVLDSLQVANRRGEDISSAEHMAGAGLSNAGFYETAMRLAYNNYAEFCEGDYPYAMMMESAAHIWRNPQQVWLEGIYGSSTEAGPMLEQQAKDGLDIAWVEFENDRIFPPEMTERQLGGLAIRKYVTQPGETRHGCHGSPLDDPEGTARVLHEMLLSREQPETPPHLQAA